MGHQTTLLYDGRKAAAEAVDREISILSAQSRLTKNETLVRELDWDDLELGSVLGLGGFSQVFHVYIGKKLLDVQNHGEVVAPDTRETTRKSYAMKCLRPRTMASNSLMAVGAIDLATEGEMLSRLSHENIIRLHAVTIHGPTAALLQNPKGYFLVLDLLSGGTLSDRLQESRARVKKSPAGIDGYLVSKEEMVQRLRNVALGVAKGLGYLHQNNIVLRDLKPGNVGFDANNTPKLFDFGFARERHMIIPGEVAGSLRYMSPEAAKGRFELASDVYSFGVVLWELLTLRRPFQSYAASQKVFEKHVYRWQWRPSTSSIPSTDIRRLIRNCWDPNPSRRPTMKEAIHAIEVEIDSYRLITNPEEALPESIPPVDQVGYSSDDVPGNILGGPHESQKTNPAASCLLTRPPDCMPPLRPRNDVEILVHPDAVSAAASNTSQVKNHRLPPVRSRSKSCPDLFDTNTFGYPSSLPVDTSSPECITQQCRKRLKRIPGVKPVSLPSESSFWAGVDSILATCHYSLPLVQESAPLPEPLLPHPSPAA